MTITRAMALGLIGACLVLSARGQIVSDDFNKPNLNTNLWNWIDPVGDCSYSIGGYGGTDVVLVVNCPAGAGHDPWTANTSAQILQPAPDQDFEVSAKFESIPALYNQEEGFLVMDSTGTNFLRFNIQVQPTLIAFMLIIDNGNGNTLAGGTWQLPVSSLAIPSDGSNNGEAWLKLKRQGNTWTFSVSPDGVNWETIYQPIQQAWTVSQVGLYVGDGGTGYTASIDYFFNDASPIVYEDGQNPPPSVAITAPANGATVILPTNLVVTASATDVAGSIKKVDFYDGTNLLGTAASSPYSITWINPSLGSHSVYAVATDSLGLTAPSPTITIQAVLPEAVTITAPANQSVFTNPASVVLAASASDVAGSITKIEFFDVGFYGGLTLIGTANTNPCSITWTAPSTGWHTLEVKATDSLGYAASSSIRIQMYVTNAAPVSDDFNHATLNTSLWTWLDPQGDDTYAISGYGTTDVVFSVTVSGNENHDAWVNNNCAVLLQNAVDQDFEVTAKWETIPGVGNGEYGFLVYDPTGTNFLRFDVQGNMSGLTGYLLMIQDNNGSTLCNGNWGQSVSLVPPTDGTDNGIAYMRLKRQGDQWTYLLSSDGLSWTPVYQTVQQVWTVAQVGPFFGGQGITYNLDYFFNDASPILNEDGQAAPPTVTFSTPADGAVFTVPTNILLTANVVDVDSSVSSVSYYTNGGLIGTATSSPFSITWVNPGVGVYSVTAQATDKLGATGSSLPITVTVVIPGGSLSGAVAPAASSYDLTSLGTIDWAYWDDGSNPYIDKASGGGLISDVTQIGGGTYGQYHDPSRNITWSDGNPILSGTNDNNYAWCNGTADSGWTFTVPADTTSRTLHVIVGGPVGSSVQITAQLSDFSAPDFTDTTSGTSGLFTKEYALTYSAASASQILTITEIHTNPGGPSCDLVAAWLVSPPPPSLAMTRSGNSIVLAWPSSPAGYGLVYATSLSAPITWSRDLTAVVVAAGQNTVTVPIGAGARFYRLIKL